MLHGHVKKKGRVEKLGIFFGILSLLAVVQKRLRIVIIVGWTEG